MSKVAMVAGGAVLLVFVFVPLPQVQVASSYCDPLQGWHLLGCSPLGEDVISLLIWGTAKTVLIAVGGRLLATLLSAFGFVGAYLAGNLGHALINRLSEAFMTIPSLLLALAFGFVLGAGAGAAVIAIGISEWALNQKFLLARLDELTRLSFIDASRSLGAGRWHIMRYHLSSHLWADLRILFFLYFPTSILTVASLEFLGLSSSDSVAGLGYQVAAYKDYLFRYPHISLPPMVMIILVVLGAAWLKSGLSGNLKNDQG